MSRNATALVSNPDCRSFSVTRQPTSPLTDPAHLAAVRVVRIRRQRRQRLSRVHRQAHASVQPEVEHVVAEDLDHVRPIEGERAFAERAKEADVALVAKLRDADRRVARIVRREVVERRDPRIG